MDKISSSQKKKNITSYIYAAIVALLVIACAVTIAFVNAKNTTTDANIGGEDVVQVAASTFVVPIRNASIAKDYSASELQYNDTLKQWEIHKAIDFVAGDDLQVYAVADGTVSNVYTNYLEGTVIEISHNNGIRQAFKNGFKLFLILWQ